MMNKPNRRWLRSNTLQIECAYLLLSNLSDKKLKVTLIPANDGNDWRKLRVAVSQNPNWYRDMAQRRGYDRRGKAKRYGNLRNQIINCLRRVADGWYDPIGYECELFETVAPYLIEEGYIYPIMYNALTEPGFKYGCSSRYKSLLKDHYE